MFPLREELLPDPVKLRCGAVVQEYRGAAKDVAKLNRLFYGICENDPRAGTRRT